MKKKITRTMQTLALVLMALCLTIPVANAQYYEAWVARHDGPEILEISSNDYVRDMVIRDGYVYVTGYEDSFGSLDWATVKYDYAGQELWVRKFEEGPGQAEAMLVDADGNVYVTGYNAENYIIDVWTFKYSPDGDLLWQVSYSNPAGNPDKPKDMAFDASGNIYIAGSSDNDARDDVDLLLLKYDSDGNLLWDRTCYGWGTHSNAGYKLAIDPDGNAIVAGWAEPNPYLVKYSPTGDLLWEDVHEGFSTHDWWQEIETDAEGNIYVLGEISPPSQGNHIWTAKYDPNGNILWEDNYTGTHDYACYEGGIALMPDGGVVICGQSWDEPSNISIVTIRYAPDGTKLWQQLEKAGYAHTSGDDVAVDANGNIYVTGFGYNYTYWEDIITLGYSPDGDLLWTQIYAGPDYDSQSDTPQEIAVDEDLNVFVAAHSWGDDSNDFTTIKYSQVTAIDPVEAPGVGAHIVMNEPRPNPFNSSTTISYETPGSGRVQVAIFDASGRQVRTLLDTQQEAGTHNMLFDSRDDTGRKLTSGIYHVRVTMEGFSAMQKLVLL